MNKIKFFLLLSAILFPYTTWAEDYAAAWTEIGVEKSLSKQWSLGMETEFRAQEKKRWSLGANIGYKPIKYLKFGASYNFMLTQKPEKFNDKSDFTDQEITEQKPDEYKKGYNRFPRYWYPRHRFGIEATGSVKLWKWLKVSLRERYQLTYRPKKTIDKYEYREEYTHVIAPGEDFYRLDDTRSEWGHKDVKKQTDQVLRSRLKLEYDKKGCKWSPFVSAEAHNSLASGDHMVLTKVRTALGTSYKFNKQHEVTLAYMLTFGIHDDDEELQRIHERIHAINIGYSFGF